MQASRHPRMLHAMSLHVCCTTCSGPARAFEGAGHATCSLSRQVGERYEINTGRAQQQAGMYSNSLTHMNVITLGGRYACLCCVGAVFAPHRYCRHSGKGRAGHTPHPHYLVAAYLVSHYKFTKVRYLLLSLLSGSTPDPAGTPCTRGASPTHNFQLHVSQKHPVAMLPLVYLCFLS